MPRLRHTVAVASALLLTGCLQEQQRAGAAGGAGGGAGGGGPAGDDAPDQPGGADGGSGFSDDGGGGSGFDGGGFSGSTGADDGGQAQVGGLDGADPCEGLDCDDGIGCTIDLCSRGECRPEPDHDRCNAGLLCIPADGGCVEGAGDPEPGPRIRVDPRELRLDAAPGGPATFATLRVSNQGGGELVVEEIDLNAGPDSPLTLSFSEGSPVDRLPASLTGEAADDFIELRLRFEPARAGEQSGRVRIRSNDPDRGEIVVPIIARAGGACLAAAPMELDFGGVPAGQRAERTVALTNCGVGAVTIRGFDFAPGASPEFELTERPRLPFRLEPGVGARVVVSYTPGDDGGDGGALVVRADLADAPDLQIRLFGRGVPVDPVGGECDVLARIVGGQAWARFPDDDQALAVVPLQTIELRGELRGGRAAAFQWSVTQRPDGSTARLNPDDRGQEAALLIDLAGDYTLELVVTDAQGQQCGPSRLFVEAVPDEDIHVQLVWDTPADPDQTDRGFGAGADVDLHLLHPLGSWFCAPRDCYYANPDPDWGAPFDGSDDPSLDIDDTDGAGPEIINLDNPVDNPVYGVGVHYFNDHGHGPSFATLRIYIHGVLRFEIADRQLPATDAFWNVGTIAWPSGEIRPVDQVSAAPPDAGCE